MVYKLILLRHGESEWNSQNLFTGWVDVDLNEKGIAEGQKAGQLLKDKGFYPDVLHTSLLKRAIKTANFALDPIERLWIPVKRSWRLNERHYGDLQGKNKSEIRAEYGDELFAQWRRSYDVPPPDISPDSEYNQQKDPRYAGIVVPLAESLKLVLERVLPYWEDDIKPDLKKNNMVLVTAHGNSLRALVKHLDGLTEEEVTKLNLPTGIPLYYELDENFKPIKKGGEYLDPEAAAASIEAVKNQGK